MSNKPYLIVANNFSYIGFCHGKGLNPNNPRDVIRIIREQQLLGRPDRTVYIGSLPVGMSISEVLDWIECSECHAVWLDGTPIVEKTD